MDLECQDVRRQSARLPLVFPEGGSFGGCEIGRMRQQMGHGFQGSPEQGRAGRQWEMELGR